MKKGLFKLKMNFEDQEIIDSKFNSFEKMEDSFNFIKKKFGGR